MTIARLTADHFRDHLKSVFQASIEHAVTPLTLVEVKTLGERPDAPRQPFSLVFEGASTPALPQNTYAMTHPSMGELAIFLVPIARDEEGARYEAVFG